LIAAMIGLCICSMRVLEYGRGPDRGPFISPLAKAKFSFKSPPAQKASPLPVKIIDHTSSSSLALCHASSSAQ
jgi:hypothetical protein